MDKRFRRKTIMMNSLSGLIVVLVNTVMQFLNRTVFIHYLGKTYLGYNGLFSNVLGVLSLTELGIGSAIIFSLYKPLREGNKLLIIKLMYLFKKIYALIGIIVLFLGIGAYFLIRNQITGSADKVAELTITYFLFLLGSVSAYYLTYKRSIFDADQKGYKNQLNFLVFNSLSSIVQMLMLILFKDFLLYAGVTTIFNIIGNIVIAKQVDREYPFLSTKLTSYNLDDKLLGQIKKLTIGNFSNKLGTVVVYGTDNIFISIFAGISSVGLYSNYALIVNTLVSMVSRAFSGLTSTIGIMKTKESQKNLKNYRSIHMVNLFITIICIGGLSGLGNIFIQLWIGKEYVLPVSITNIIVINFAIEIYRRTSLTYIDAYGLAWVQRWKSIIEVVLNITLSVFFAGILKWGLLGILMGTTISIVVFPLWYEPYVVYKYGFKVNFREYGKIALIALISIACEYILVLNGKTWSSQITQNLVTQFLMNIIIVILSSLVIITTLLYVTPDGRELWKNTLERGIQSND
ncbi:lipopolysaccharide biosynthesis protein [Leuconostoc mesenteroides]|uniref:lipopolysaccharide biosynthesis protein n=1 Tax=Leuconostoc mesenteroides TaxID=1245 RepID=UPI003D2EBDE4